MTFPIVPLPNPCTSVGPVPVPLFPPVIVDEERRFRVRDPPGASINIIPNQTASGTLQLAGTNFIDGDIRINNNSIVVRRYGRYIVDLNVQVSYPVAGNNSALFSIVPGYGVPIAGGSSSSTGTQVYSGSTIVQAAEGSTISVVATLTGATVLGGTLTVQMIPDTDRRREF